MGVWYSVDFIDRPVLILCAEKIALYFICRVMNIDRQLDSYLLVKEEIDRQEKA